jgi:hypothetical protein
VSCRPIPCQLISRHHQKAPQYHRLFSILSRRYKCTRYQTTHPNHCSEHSLEYSAPPPYKTLPNRNGSERAVSSCPSVSGLKQARYLYECPGTRTSRQTRKYLPHGMHLHVCGCACMRMSAYMAWSIHARDDTHGDATDRWAVPKASLTYMSKGAASFLEKELSHFSSSL